MTIKKIIFILLVLWIFSITVSVFPTFGFGEIKFANILSSCSLIVVGRNFVSTNNNFFILLCIIGVVPFATIFIANLCVLIIICRSIHQKNLQKLNVSVHEVTNQENKTDVISHFHKEQMHLTRLFGSIFLVSTHAYMHAHTYACMHTRKHIHRGREGVGYIHTGSREGANISFDKCSVWRKYYLCSLQGLDTHSTKQAHTCMLYRLWNEVRSVFKNHFFLLTKK